MKLEEKHFLWIVGITAYLLVNLPFFYVVQTQYDNPETILAIAGHAPNQFLFLLVFFPLAVFAVLKTHSLIYSLAHSLSKDNHATKLYRFFRHGGLLAVGLVIGITVAVIDSKVTPASLYQWQPEKAREAAHLNQEVILGWGAGHDKKDANPDDRAKYDRAKRELEALYQEHEGIHLEHSTILFFEEVELAVAVSFAFVYVILIYCALLINGAIRKVRLAGNVTQYSKKIKELIPFGILFVSATLFWPPLRIYNLMEIEHIKGTLPTTAPVFVYLFCALLTVALLWLYYAKLNSNAFEKFLAIMPLVFSGGLIGMTNMAPEALVYVVGSGMGINNLVVMAILLVFVGLFGHQFWIQSRHISQDP